MPAWPANPPPRAAPSNRDSFKSHVFKPTRGLRPVRADLRTLADDYVADGDRTADLVSPLFADLTGLPPLLIQAGSHEILLDDATRLATRAATADVAVRLEVTPGVPHVFQGFAAMLDEGDAALTSDGEFLRAHLAGPRP